MTKLPVDRRPKPGLKADRLPNNVIDFAKAKEARALSRMPAELPLGEQIQLAAKRFREACRRLEETVTDR